MAINLNQLPGAEDIKIGTKEEGYFGPVSASELITGSALASKVNVTEGDLQNSDTTWHKFAFKEKILFVSQNTIRNSTSWNHLNKKGVVYGKNISIGGVTYKVRLLRGTLTDPGKYRDPDRGAKGSEWNRLILPLHRERKENDWSRPENVDSDLQDWETYLSNDDMNISVRSGNGSKTWCQETWVGSDNTSYRLARGYNNVSEVTVNGPAGVSEAGELYPSNGWRPVLEVIGDIAWNTPPQVQDKTLSGKTLYEQNILNINGSVMDMDANDVVSAKYRVNSGAVRPLATGIGSTTYNKSLQFKQGYLYDGDTKVSTQLSDGTQHNIRLWAEDDKGAKSEEVVITFYVVNNRPSKLQIDQILEQNDLVESDTVLLTGRVEDPEGHDTTIFYRVGGSSYSKVNTGKDRDFEIRIPVSKLINGENLVTIRSEDTYGAITERTVRLTKSGISTPLKTGIIEYKLTPPDKVAKGLLIWIQREIGDLSTKVEVKFGNNPYKTLEKNHVGLVTEGLEEDEYVYENDTEESDIRIRITMSRMSTSSNKAIKKISGVFN